MEATYATLGTAVLLATALFLLGAPSSTWLRTPLFGLHLALLTAWPVAYTLGIPSIHDQGIAARARLTRLLCSWKAENARERILAFPIAGTLIGAWIGAVPIALDWDRPWQVRNFFSLRLISDVPPHTARRLSGRIRRWWILLVH